MPNLQPPVTDTVRALAYRSQILDAVPDDSDFEPLMTLFLTDQTAPEDIHQAVRSGVIYGAKLYPAGATTHSKAGVTDIARIESTLHAMAELGLPLLVHGETTDTGVDVFDREEAFLSRTLQPLRERFPELAIVLEHVTTAEGIDFVKEASGRTAGTITPHHLLLNRNAMFLGGLRPHHFCLPVLKRERHRRALVAAATSGNPRFFLGTDSAPHRRGDKESACGCAGIYNAFAAMPLYAEAFEDADSLDKLEGFASVHGADFYGLPRNTGTVTLVREAWEVPETFSFGDDHVVPLRAGERLRWRVEEIVPC